MVFLSRNRKKSENENNKNTNHEYEEVFNELAEKKNFEMNSSQIFLKETILYKNKTKAEFEKDSYNPSIRNIITGKKPSVPGVKKAAEKAFSKKDDVHKNIDLLLNLTNKYENNMIYSYNKEDLLGMLNNFDGYSKNFEKIYNNIEKKSRSKGEKIVAATRQIWIDFLQYQIDVIPYIKNMRNELDTTSYIS